MENITFQWFFYYPKISSWVYEQVKMEIYFCVIPKVEAKFWAILAGLVYFGITATPRCNAQLIKICAGVAFLELAISPIKGCANFTTIE